MFTHLLNKKIVLTFTSLVAAGALVIGGLFVPAAYAAAPHDDPTPTSPLNGAGLEYMCRQEGLLLQGQQNRLDFSNEVAGDAQTYIDELNGKGKDTSGLVTALAAYKTAIATAQGQHDTAQRTYTTQAGFDGSCKVTDRAQARTTLQTVRDNLRIAHRTISDGTLAFRLAVREWRRANHVAAATATP